MPIVHQRRRGALPCSIHNVIGKPSVVLFAVLLLAALIGAAYASGYVAGRLIS